MDGNYCAKWVRFRWNSTSRVPGVRPDGFEAPAIDLVTVLVALTICRSLGFGSARRISLFFFILILAIAHLLCEVTLDATNLRARSHRNLKSAHLVPSRTWLEMWIGIKKATRRRLFHWRRSRILAEWTGLEPATPGVTGRYSNQLNYHSW